MGFARTSEGFVDMAPRRGFEPLTCPLGGGRAIHLCHRGGFVEEEMGTAFTSIMNGIKVYGKTFFG